MLDQIANIEQYNKIKNEKKFFILLFYTDSSDKSREAFTRLEQVKSDYDDTPVYAVNASKVRDIHPMLGVNSVPTVLALKHGNIAKNLQGLQTRDHYEMLLWEAPAKSTMEMRKKKSGIMWSFIQHPVAPGVVDSNPICAKAGSGSRKWMFPGINVQRKNLCGAADKQVYRRVILMDKWLWGLIKPASTNYWV